MRNYSTIVYKDKKKYVVHSHQQHSQNASQINAANQAKYHEIKKALLGIKIFQSLKIKSR